MSAVEEFKQAVVKFPPVYGAPRTFDHEVLVAKALVELIERVERLEGRAEGDAA